MAQILHITSSLRTCSHWSLVTNPGNGKVSIEFRKICPNNNTCWFNQRKLYNGFNKRNIRIQVQHENDTKLWLKQQTTQVLLSKTSGLTSKQKGIHHLEIRCNIVDIWVPKVAQHPECPTSRYEDPKWWCNQMDANNQNLGMRPPKVGVYDNETRGVNNVEWTNNSLPQFGCQNCLPKQALIRPHLLQRKMKTKMFDSPAPRTGCNHQLNQKERKIPYQTARHSSLHWFDVPTTNDCQNSSRLNSLTASMANELKSMLHASLTRHCVSADFIPALQCHDGDRALRDVLKANSYLAHLPVLSGVLKAAFIASSCGKSKNLPEHNELQEIMSMEVPMNKIAPSW